jgi:hypothetical protein
MNSSGTFLSQLVHDCLDCERRGPSRCYNSDRFGVSPAATALLLVRFRSSRQTAGLTPCTSLTHHAQSHRPMDGTAHAPCRTRIRLAPSIGAAQMDRAKTPTQSGLVTRIGGEERPTGGDDAGLPVCREAITPCSPSRPALRRSRMLASVLRTALTAALSVWRRPSTQAIPPGTIRRK